jgi:hypothetical protein
MKLQYSFLQGCNAIAGCRGLNIPKNNVPTPSGSSGSVQAGNASASTSLQPTQLCYKELVAMLMKYTNMILCNILGQATDFTAMLLQPLI